MIRSESPPSGGQDEQDDECRTTDESRTTVVQRGQTKMNITANRLTLEDFLALPEEEVALEFVEGEVTQKMSPKPVHSRLQGRLFRYLDDFAEQSGLAVVFPKLRVTFAGASRVPDIAVYRRDRIPFREGHRLPADFLIPPDITIEIASPQQSVTTLIRKCLWYVANGVAIAVLVDAEDETVLIFRPGEAMAVLRDDDRIDLDSVLPGFQLTCRALFATLNLGQPDNPPDTSASD